LRDALARAVGVRYVRNVRPRLRSVETIVVPDARHGKVLVLRDTQGIAHGHAVLPPALIPIVGRFTGRLTCGQIAKEASLELGGVVDTEVVEGVARQLDEGLFLEGETFDRALERVREDFAHRASRPASHAGGAYPDEKVKLTDYIDHTCIEAAKRQKLDAPIVALVSPHIDPWRGAIGYGHAYGALAASLADGAADTFVVLGTSHAPMSAPFALCRKGYETPLGTMPVDEAFLDELAAAASFDPYADELNHKREHSIEFQAVFLKHVLGQRRATIVPILAGLGREQASRQPPRETAAVARFLDALKEGIERRGGRVVVVAGADMAHVGPRFGDPSAHDATKRAALERVDRASLDLAARHDAASFWEHVAGDLDERRVCGLAPIFSLLDALPTRARGEVLHYEQNVDPEDGSIVSYASLAFRA
jgi:AmmeMemoRadiSam system protein B